MRGIEPKGCVSGLRPAHARGRLFVAVGFSDHRGFVVPVLLVVVFVFVVIIVASVQKGTPLVKGTQSPLANINQGVREQLDQVLERSRA